jgi:hypothetical protein
MRVVGARLHWLGRHGPTIAGKRIAYNSKQFLEHDYPVMTGMGCALCVVAPMAICDSSESVERDAMNDASQGQAFTSTTLAALAASSIDCTLPVPGGCVPSPLPAHVVKPDEAAL